MSEYVIYTIKNHVNSKCYVGLTTDFARRKYQHFLALKNGTHHSRHLQGAYEKYGRSGFVMSIIESGVSLSEVEAREIFWIQYFNSFSDGYNMTSGGFGFPNKKTQYVTRLYPKPRNQQKRRNKIIKKIPKGYEITFSETLLAEERKLELTALEDEVNHLWYELKKKLLLRELFPRREYYQLGVLAYLKALEITLSERLMCVNKRLENHRKGELLDTIRPFVVLLSFVTLWFAIFTIVLVMIMG